jgi:hypothetical protein
MKRAKRRPKPLTAVNRKFLFSQKKSRIYLYCGEAITDAAQVLKLRNSGQFCAPFMIRNIIIACPTRPAGGVCDLDD